MHVQSFIHSPLINLALKQLWHSTWLIDRHFQIFCLEVILSSPFYFAQDFTAEHLYFHVQQISILNSKSANGPQLDDCSDTLQLFLLTLTGEKNRMSQTTGPSWRKLSSRNPTEVWESCLNSMHLIKYSSLNLSHNPLWDTVTVHVHVCPGDYVI